VEHNYWVMCRCWIAVDPLEILTGDPGSDAVAQSPCCIDSFSRLAQAGADEGNHSCSAHSVVEYMVTFRWPQLMARVHSCQRSISAVHPHNARVGCLARVGTFSRCWIGFHYWV